MRALARQYAQLIRSKFLDRVVAIVVVLNGICMALEVDVDPEEMPWLDKTLERCEKMFALFFLTESISKAVVFGPKACFSSRQYCFEFFLAVTGAADLYLIDFTLFGGASSDIGLNILPLLRVVRFAKVLKHGELALIARCFFPAFGTMLYVAVFLFLIVFMFSIPLVRLVGQNSMWKGNPEITQLFGSVPRAFYALLQFVINPDTATMRILFEEQAWTAPFLMLFVGMTTFTTMSIIVGSVTDSYKEFSDAERARDRRQEVERQERIRKNLLRDLREADKNEVGLSGALSVKEFAKQLHSRYFQDALADLGTSQATVMELLETLEVDGHVYYEEVVNALGLLGQGAQATHVLWLKAHIAEETMRLERKIGLIETSLVDVKRSVDDGLRGLRDELRAALGGGPGLPGAASPALR